MAASSDGRTKHHNAEQVRAEGLRLGAEIGQLQAITWIALAWTVAMLVLTIASEIHGAAWR